MLRQNAGSSKSGADGVGKKLFTDRFLSLTVSAIVTVEVQLYAFVCV